MVLNCRRCGHPRWPEPQPPRLPTAKLSPWVRRHEGKGKGKDGKGKGDAPNTLNDKPADQPTAPKRCRALEVPKMLKEIEKRME
eukprot:12328944-Alexandrium_andersonii.AAC.1